MRNSQGATSAGGSAPSRAGLAVRSGTGVLTSAVLCAALTTAFAAPAHAAPPNADKSDRAFPSQDDVAAAEERVRTTAQQVGAIKASLLLANNELEAAAVEAEQASEEYNGAMWRLEVARQEVKTARADAAEARRTVAEQRKAIGALVAATYRRAGQLTAVSALMSADGPEGVLDQYATFQGASDSLQADYDRFAATDAMAQVFEERAREAEAKAERLAKEARGAKERATAAAAAAQATAARIAAQKDELIRELARAQNISVSLARKRQAALEEIARKRAEARARAEAEAAARQQELDESRRQAERRREARAAAARAQREERAREASRDREDARRREQARERESARDRRRQQQTRTTRDESRNAPQQPAAPQPVAAPPPPRPPSGSGGAERAIAFARAQIGDPYVWGAAGPDSWDCSGLMLAAWGQAGVSLPHYSVAQYYAGTPISAASLRPGDLVFWGSSSSPESIYHVAMYIGGGQIIHSPRTGRSVSVESMYYWTPPNFFARV